MQALMLEHAFWLRLQRCRPSLASRMLACPRDIGGQCVQQSMAHLWWLQWRHMLNYMAWRSCSSAQSEGAASSQTSGHPAQGPTGYPSMLALQEIEAAVPDASKKDIGRAYKAVVTLLQKENKVLPLHAAASLPLHLSAAALLRSQLRAHTACLSDSRALWCHAACPAKL